MDRDDARVVELPRDLSFFEEAPERLRIDLGCVARLFSLAEDDLHGEVPAQVLVPDAEDRALTSAGYLSFQ